MADKQARNLFPPSQHHPLTNPPLCQGQFCKGRSNNSLWLRWQESPQGAKLSAVTGTSEVLQKGLLLFILKESTILNTLEFEHILTLTRKFTCFKEGSSKITAPNLRGFD